MKTAVYSAYLFEKEPLWEEVSEKTLGFSNWDSETHYDTFFKMCLVKGKGIYVRMRTNETKLRTLNTERDSNIWEDSCMEFFFRPFAHREEYLNFEMNPNGAWLCQYGKGRDGRVFLKDLTDCSADIKTDVNTDGWKLELFVPCELISEAFGEEFFPQEGTLKGNFYKCGDLTEKVHYDSFAEMTTLPPGFHNPDCFAEIVISGR